MIRLTELRLPLDHSDAQLRAAIVTRLGIADGDLRAFTIWKRSPDARKKSALVFSYTVLCEVTDEESVLAAFEGDAHVRIAPDTSYRFVTHAPADFARSDAARPVVIGFGPCGIFAALVLAQMGFRPIVLERGKAVRERTADTWGLWRKGVLDPESNVQFGEGGAGTFSDGKLWSQISDPRHLTRKVLNEFVKAGAPEEILYASKPHIGTFRLVGVVEKMRAEIERLGGEVRFQQRVVDVLLDEIAGSRQDGQSDGPRFRMRGLTVVNAAHPDGEHIDARQVVLAPGHSARDTFEMLHARGVHVEAKPFSIGFRIEHPQGVIDRARYGVNAGNPLLGAADYKLVHHASNGRAVYSFCMCPGGTVVAATSEVGRVVTNGMSQYSRNERNANAGIVVGLTPADTRRVDGAGRDEGSRALDGIHFQRQWETRAFDLGGGDYRAPGQRVGDFLKRQSSGALGNVEPSYKPGVHAVDLGAKSNAGAPNFVIEAIREALPAFERQIKGFAMPDAVLTGIETRTSSPVRITRGEGRESLNVSGLYPAGEGAGYAGGIMSAAVDGIETSEALALALAFPSEPLPPKARRV